MKKQMLKYLRLQQTTKIRVKCFLISLFIFIIFLPTVSVISLNNDKHHIFINTLEKSFFCSDSLTSSSFNTSTINNIKIIEDNPEAIFPNFLHYSVITANAMIDYLYDNGDEGFYSSADEHWSETSIVLEKKTYDQAQAILALLKLSQAVLNVTQSEYALDKAEKTGNYLISHLYDDDFGGFFSSTIDRFKRPGIEGRAIESLIDLFRITGNVTYRDMAEDTFEFIDTNGWDNFYGGYYYKLSHTGALASPSVNEFYEPDAKRVDHNAIMGSAILDLYALNSDITYLNKAITIFELMNTSSLNTETGLFYGGYKRDGTIVNPDSTDLFVNTLMIEFLSKLYTVTGETYYLDVIQSLIKEIVSRFWDDQYGGFYPTYEFTYLEDRDMKKYTERQFYAIIALDEVYRLTNNSLYYNLIYDTIEFLNANLYDQSHEGYYQLANDNGDPGDPTWRNKHCVTQSLAILELSKLWLYSKPGVLNALWLPSIPRPQDSVTIVVAAFDSDGIADVLCNYSINGQAYEIVQMIEDTQIGNMYNTSFDSQPVDTTINFNIIVNDTLGNEVVRGSYFFLWQYDIWSPHVELLRLNPGNEVPVHSKVTVTVSSHDVPIQGSVGRIRIYYHLEGKDEDSKPLTRVDAHIWQIEFSDGFKVPGTYAYYFEAVDDKGNFGFSEIAYIYVLGQLETVPLLAVIGGLFFVLFITPASVAIFKEYQKKTAKGTLVRIKNSKGMKRRRRTRRTRHMEN